MAVTGPKATHESRLSRVPAWAVLMIFAFGENGALRHRYLSVTTNAGLEELPEFNPQVGLN